MTIEELTEIATEFLRENYGMELGIPIVRNGRLRTSQGRYVTTNEDVPLRIEIAGYVLSYGARSVIIGVLKHELIHYALDVRGEPNDDGHPHFEAELKKYGAPATGMDIVGKYYVATCRKCGANTYGRNKRITALNQRFTSTCCKSPVDYVGERIYNGTEAI